MIHHHAFFETLGTLREGTPEWTSVFSGLSVMRLVDHLIEAEKASQPTDWSQLAASRASAEAVRVGDPVRAIHLRIIKEVTAAQSLSDGLGSALMSYGRALDLEARWVLATDVFKSVADVFPERPYSRLVIEASIALGAAARNSGDWETSARAYARAEHLANTIRDDELALTAQVGMAGSQMVQGNLPAAEAELEEVLVEAGRLDLENVRALALHARASVSHLRGDYQQAIHSAYRSLELTTNATARERILADIAAAYAGLGMRKTARDGYSIVAMTSPHQWVRWQATLNLIELCVEEGDEAGFSSYMQQLDMSALDPRLRAYALFFEAMASRRFGTGDYVKQFEQARDYAEANRLNQIAFQIEEAISQPVDIPAEAVEASGDFSSTDELTRIAEELGYLRERASA